MEMPVLIYPQDFQFWLIQTTPLVLPYRIPNKNYLGYSFTQKSFTQKVELPLIRNFVYHVCECEPTWTTEAFVDESIRDIRAKVGDKRVLLALSGGVDSSTLAFLLHRAIGDNLTCMFIDQGFMRKGEPERTSRNI